MLTREMAAHFAFRGVPRERHLLWRDQNGDPVPGSEMLVADIPMRRLGLPEEVTKAIYFLCTEQSSCNSGAELHINGGRHV